jgi:hypothetical protein
LPNEHVMRNCRRIDDASRARSSWFFYANWACAPCPYHQAGSEIKRGISLWERSDYNVAARSFWQADLRKKQVSQVLSSTRHEPHRYVHFGKVHIECRQGRKLDRKQTKRLQRDEDTEREREREARKRGREWRLDLLRSSIWSLKRFFKPLCPRTQARRDLNCDHGNFDIATSTLWDDELLNMN